MGYTPQPPTRDLFPTIAQRLTAELETAYAQSRRFHAGEIKMRVRRTIARIEKAARELPEFQANDIAEMLLFQLPAAAASRAYERKYDPATAAALYTVMTAAALVILAQRQPLENYSEN